MNNSAKALAKNIRRGSGNHGLSEEELYDIFSQIKNLDQFTYSLKKCAELSGTEFFVTQELSVEPPKLTDFTAWHHIDEQWNADWGFDKKHPGCYVYGVYENGAPNTNADFLDEGVIYIGESRAVTRNCMLGRRTDFKGTVRNNRLSPYGCGTAFKEKFGKEKIDNTYQAYLPMHPSLCKDTELKLLGEFYKKFGRIPACNPPLDEVKVKKYLGID